MTIDQRLEALTKIVERVAAIQRDNEKRFADNEKRFSQVTRNFEVVLDSIKRLENIAAGHEQRLDDIEGQR